MPDFERHAARHLPRRLTVSYNHYHDLALATLHVHLDPDHCMEVIAPRGQVAELQHFAEHVMAERGVRNGRMAMVPAGTGQLPSRKPHGHR